MFAKNWKLFAVVAVVIWSVTTLFQFLPDARLHELQRIANVPAKDLQADIMSRLEKRPDWHKLSLFQREDAIKELQEEASTANNMQVLGKIGGINVVSNLKLGLDLKGGSQLMLQALPSKQVPQITPEVMNVLENVITNRVNSLGVSETIVQRTGKDRLIVELPGVKDPQEAKDRIGTTALLEFKALEYSGADGNSPPKVDELGNPVWKDVGITGSDFKHATAVPMAGGQNWRILFEFKPDGAQKFGDLTEKSVGKKIGIFLDGQPTERGADGRPLPMKEYLGINVREPIRGGSGEITGSFTKDQAVDLALKLNAGSLPTTVAILEERTVGATLGQDSIEKSLMAGVIGISLVMLFMLIIYGIPGLIANICLILYTITTLAIFKAIPVTLTLAGIAGFILSIGMAVDANILIFERTKEEVAGGKNVFNAIEIGFSRAFSSIFDSNMNSLIACGILMVFGTSIVKGFAVTLALGVVTSMFTAITATRALMHLVPRGIPLFGAPAKKAPSVPVASSDAKSLT